jgi:uncharacterized protein YciI
MAYVHHRADLQGGASGNFLISGRQIPRVGGIILATANSREEVEAIAREDPFCARGLSDFRVIEFRASQRGGDIEQRIAADVQRMTPTRRPSRGTRGR